MVGLFPDIISVDYIVKAIQTVNPHYFDDHTLLPGHLSESYFIGEERKLASALIVQVREHSIDELRNY
jgi:hypothetical protein